MSITLILSWIILLMIGVVILVCIFEETDPKKQLHAALVLIPIVLRTFMIK